MTYRPGILTRTLLSLAIGLVPAVALNGTAAAQQQEQQQEQQSQREHIVKRGDTLWDLAGFYLTNPFLWPSIFELNRSVVEDPHWIYPDERLLIPPMQGDATTDMDPEVGPDVIPDPANPPVADPLTFGPSGPSAERTRFYRPTAQSAPDQRGPRFVAAQELVRPAVTAHEYRAAPWLQNANELTVLGRIHGLTDPATDNDVLSGSVQPYDRIYIRDISGLPAVGDTVLAVRVGRNLNGLGDVISPLALIQIDTVAAQAAVGTIVRQFAPALDGDILIALEPVPNIPLGRAQTLANGATGNVADLYSDQAIYLTTNRAFLDIGSAAGVGVGDELVAYYPERRDSDGVLVPAESVATMRVVKVRNNTATVRVLEVNTTAFQAGLPVRVVRQLR